MFKHKNIYLLGLGLATFLVGCGGGNSTNTQANNNTNNGSNPSSMNNQFTADVMPILESNCKTCHGSNGNFSISTPSGTYSNISDLKASVPQAGQYLYQKASNTISHGGGMVLSPSSNEYATIKAWVTAGADFN